MVDAPQILSGSEFSYRVSLDYFVGLNSFANEYMKDHIFELQRKI